jgi:hypothetical protein
MKIVKLGDTSKLDPTLYFVCNKCGCEFECNQSECNKECYGKYENYQCVGQVTDYFYRCPCCTCITFGKNKK